MLKDSRSSGVFVGYTNSTAILILANFVACLIKFAPEILLEIAFIPSILKPGKDGGQ